MHHSGWSWSTGRVFLLVDFMFVVYGHYRRRLHRLVLWHGWGHVVWDLLSRTIVLQLWHSIWNILMQKASIARHPWCSFTDEIKSWSDGWLRVPWYIYQLKVLAWRGPNLMLMDMSWLIQVIGPCPLMWWCRSSVCAFLQRWKIFCSLSV